MSPTASPSTEAVPLIAAPLTADYPQCRECAPPADGLTTRAWLAEIQPFASDDDARAILPHMEAETQLWISAGRIRAPLRTESHWADPYLVQMDVSCQVLICEQVDAVPRAYLLSPLYLPHYATMMPRVHPHPRGDQVISFQGRYVPGLCVFSSAEFSFDPLIPEETQFLDLVTQYVAKHLIWLRTRRLLRFDGVNSTLLYRPQPAEQIVDEEPRLQLLQTSDGERATIDYWSGYWPGKQANAITPLQHLQQIDPTQRCWCGKREKYGDCHRESDIAQLSPKGLKLFSGSELLPTSCAPIGA